MYKCFKVLQEYKGISYLVAFISNGCFIAPLVKRNLLHILRNSVFFKEYAYLVDWLHLTIRCPPSHSLMLTPQQDRGKKHDGKTSWLFEEKKRKKQQRSYTETKKSYSLLHISRWCPDASWEANSCQTQYSMYFKKCNYLLLRLKTLGKKSTIFLKLLMFCFKNLLYMTLAVSSFPA